jgi:fumarylacetoacetate (FAA) hydrolase
MKLATLKDGTRDGQLAVVARDLKTAHIADGIAPSLQAALDDWGFIAPQLAALYEDLNAGRARRPFDFDPGRCMAPLPRAYQFVVGATYASQPND